MPEDRRLAAIMFTDIIRYTALMGKDRESAFELLRKNRTLHQELMKLMIHTFLLYQRDLAITK